MKGSKKLMAVIHTSFALVEVLNRMVEEIMPEVRNINIVDDSLLANIIRTGKVEKSVVKRMVNYFLMAEEAGAGVIVNSCSSVSETVDIARQVVKVPIIKIDEKMAELAVKTGERIGVLATLSTTIGPTSRLIEKKAFEAGKKINVQSWLCEGGFEILMAGEKEKHDELVKENIDKASRLMDVVVLAQGSMARLVPQLEKGIRKKVLSSPESGMEEVKKILSEEID